MTNICVFKNLKCCFKYGKKTFKCLTNGFFGLINLIKRIR